MTMTDEKTRPIAYAWRPIEPLSDQDRTVDLAAQLDSFESGTSDHAAARHYAVCSLEPFVIAWNTNVRDVTPLFDQWLDSALAVAFKEFADRI